MSKTFQHFNRATKEEFFDFLLTGDQEDNSGEQEFENEKRMNYDVQQWLYNQEQKETSKKHISERTKLLEEFVSENKQFIRQGYAIPEKISRQLKRLKTDVFYAQVGYEHAVEQIAKIESKLGLDFIQKEIDNYRCGAIKQELLAVVHHPDNIAKLVPQEKGGMK
jgi:hypothetical protein